MPRETFAVYADVLRTPGVRSMLLFASVARLTIGMAGLAIVLRFSTAGADYGHAGAATGSFGLGLALGSPLFVRVLARTTRPRFALAAGVITSSSGILVLSGSWATHIAATVAVAFLSGFTAPPVSALMRALWPRVVHTALQPSLYSLDATLVEATFIAGPALVGLSSWLLSPQASLALCGIPGVVGVLLLISHPVIKAVAADSGPSAAGTQHVISRAFLPTIAVLLIAAFSFGLVEIAVVAETARTGNSSTAGLVFAVAGLGSVCGGLLLGPAIIAGGRPRLAQVLLALGVIVALLSRMHTAPTIIATLAAANLLLAPTIGSVYAKVALGFPNMDRLTAFGLLYSAQIAAIGAGNFLAGVVVDHRGTTATYLLASGCVLVAGAQVRLSLSAIRVNSG